MTEIDNEDHMVQIGDLISRLQSTMDQFGNTCVYIRRGGLAWGAVALNRRDDDKKHGIFDLQAQHDRDLLQRAEQVERLIASRRSAETRLADVIKALEEIEDLGANGATAARLGNIAHAALIALRVPVSGAKERSDG